MAGAAQPLGETPIGRIAAYDDLMAVCRARVQALGINYEILDIAAGFTVGYTTKLFSHGEHSSGGRRRSKRHFSPESFDAYMAALGLELVAVENPDKVTRLKAFCDGKLLKREGPKRASAPREIIRLTHDFMRKIGRKGGLASGRKRRAVARLREVNRRNALQRWR